MLKFLYILFYLAQQVNIDKAISEKVETFLDKSGDQPYAHMNEGYVVVVEMTGEMDATDAISDYLRKRTELMY